MEKHDTEHKSLFPLVLIALYLIGGTSIVSRRIDGGDLMTWMDLFMGGFFVVFSFFKLLDINGFAKAYAMYDIIAKRSRVYALLYPFIELTLGVLYLLHAWPVFTNVATLVIMTIGMIGVAQALSAKQNLHCACLGTVFNLPMTTVTLVEDLTMAVMAAIMLFMRSI